MAPVLFRRALPIPAGLTGLKPAVALLFSPFLYLVIPALLLESCIYFCSHFLTGGRGWGAEKVLGIRRGKHKGHLSGGLAWALGVVRASPPPSCRRRGPVDCGDLGNSLFWDVDLVLEHKNFPVCGF